MAAAWPRQGRGGSTVPPPHLARCTMAPRRQRCTARTSRRRRCRQASLPPGGPCPATSRRRRCPALSPQQRAVARCCRPGLAVPRSRRTATTIIISSSSMGMRCLARMCTASLEQTPATCWCLTSVERPLLLQRHRSSFQGQRGRRLGVRLTATRCHSTAVTNWAAKAAASAASGRSRRAAGSGRRSRRAAGSGCSSRRRAASTSHRHRRQTRRLRRPTSSGCGSLAGAGFDAGFPACWAQLSVMQHCHLAWPVWGGGSSSQWRGRVSVVGAEAWLPQSAQW